MNVLCDSPAAKFHSKALSEIQFEYGFAKGNKTSAFRCVCSCFLFRVGEWNVVVYSFRTVWLKPNKNDNVFPIVAKNRYPRFHRARTTDKLSSKFSTKNSFWLLTFAWTVSPWFSERYFPSLFSLKLGAGEKEWRAPRNHCIFQRFENVQCKCRKREKSLEKKNSNIHRRTSSSHIRLTFRQSKFHSIVAVAPCSSSCSLNNRS